MYRVTVSVYEYLARWLCSISDKTNQGRHYYWNNNVNFKENCHTAVRGCDLIHNKSLIPFPRWWCVKHTDANRAGRWLKRKEGVGTENKKKRGKSFKFSNLWTGRWRNTADRGEIEDLKKHTITWHLLYVFKRKEKISLASLVLTTRHEFSHLRRWCSTLLSH